MSTLVDKGEVTAIEVACSDDALSVTLSDGRVVSVPLAWFPRLLGATAKQRSKWEFIGGGIGIHWPLIDEDISIASLLQPENFMRARERETLVVTRSKAKGRNKAQRR
jgi:hypothetical protein